MTPPTHSTPLKNRLSKEKQKVGGQLPCRCLSLVPNLASQGASSSPYSTLCKLPASYCTPPPSFLLPQSSLAPLPALAQETTHRIIIPGWSRACPEEPAKTRTLLADHARERLSAPSCLFLNWVKLCICFYPDTDFCITSKNSEICL